VISGAFIVSVPILVSKQINILHKRMSENSSFYTIPISNSYFFLVPIFLCKVYLIYIGSLGTMSKSSIVELVLPLLMVFLIKKRNKITWTMTVILLLLGIYEVFFHFPHSSFYPMAFVINPILELLTHYKFNIKTQHFLMYFLSIVLPVLLTLFITRKVRRCYACGNNILNYNSSFGIYYSLTFQR